MVYYRKGYRLKSAMGEMHRQRQEASKSRASRCPVTLGSWTALTSPGNTAQQHALSTADPDRRGYLSLGIQVLHWGLITKTQLATHVADLSLPLLHRLTGSMWPKDPTLNPIVGMAQSPHSELGCYYLAAQGTWVNKDTFIKVRHSQGLEVNFQEPRTKARPFFG